MHVAQIDSRGHQSGFSVPQIDFSPPEIDLRARESDLHGPQIDFSTPQNGFSPPEHGFFASEIASFAGEMASNGSDAAALRRHVGSFRSTQLLFDTETKSRRRTLWEHNVKDEPRRELARLVGKQETWRM